MIEAPPGRKGSAHPRWRVLSSPMPTWSWPSAIASVSATVEVGEARAIAVATPWATSSGAMGEPGALVIFWGKTNTWVFPASRRNEGACKMRSRSRSKQVRHSSGSSGSGPVPLTPGPTRLAPAARKPSSRFSRISRASGSDSASRVLAAARIRVVDPGPANRRARRTRSRISRHRRSPTQAALRHACPRGHDPCPCSLPRRCNVQVPAGPDNGTVERSQIRWTCASESPSHPGSWKWS